MELNEMTLNDVESRIAELDTEGKSTEEIMAMTEELKALNERKAELADLEALFEKIAGKAVMKLSLWLQCIPFCDNDIVGDFE